MLPFTEKIKTNKLRKMNKCNESLNPIFKKNKGHPLWYSYLRNHPDWKSKLNVRAYFPPDYSKPIEKNRLA